MYEPILMMVKKPEKLYLNDAILVETTTELSARHRLSKTRPNHAANQKKVPGNVWSFPRAYVIRWMNMKNHPTQKPSALFKTDHTASSNPSDTVLDPFAGSFTTGAAAAASGRVYRRIELNTST